MKFQLAAFADEADETLAGQIAAMAENGISYLEIRGVDGENIADLTPEKAKEVKRKLDDAGLAVWSLGSPYGKIPIEEDFAPHLEKFCRGLELAHILGARCLRLFSFYMPADHDPADFRGKVLDQLGQFVEKAAGSGIILCHENEKKIYGDVAPRCAELHTALPQLRAVFDPANFVQCGQDTLEAWKLVSPYVEYMHIKDAMPGGYVVPAGKGAGQIPALLQRYEGRVLTLEPHLAAFTGLAKLEHKDDKSMIGANRYASNREAFDAGVAALKELL